MVCCWKKQLGAELVYNAAFLVDESPLVLNEMHLSHSTCLDSIPGFKLPVGISLA